MILGIGSDLCSVARVDRLLRRFGDRFVRSVFVETERIAGPATATPAIAFARLFAAKEACVKALGTGIDGAIGWRNLVIADAADDEPVLTLLGAAADHLARMAGPIGPPAIRLSLSDDGRFASALVVIEADESSRRQSSRTHPC